MGGNVLHPGIPPAAAPGFAARPNTHVGNNFRGNGGVRRPYGGGTLLVPYPGYIDPFYAGSGNVYNPDDPIFGGGYAPPYPEGPGYNQQQPSPTVIINQNFQPDVVRPQIRDYTNVPLPEPGVTIPAPGAAAPAAPGANAAANDDRANLFLIALKDQTVLAAIAYWVQNDTLNYITMNGAQNHVSLSLVDRDLSARLNAERQVQFRLPAQK
jgi:hypothetical protein